jgi:hypothetical protein
MIIHTYTHFQSMKGSSKMKGFLSTMKKGSIFATTDNGRVSVCACVQTLCAGVKRALCTHMHLHACEEGPLRTHMHLHACCVIKFVHMHVCRFTFFSTRVCDLFMHACIPTYERVGVFGVDGGLRGACPCQYLCILHRCMLIHTHVYTQVIHTHVYTQVIHTHVYTQVIHTHVYTQVGVTGSGKGTTEWKHVSVCVCVYVYIYIHDVLWHIHA